jgi:plasmid stabilization system protein ParE
MKLRLTPQATQDLGDIADYVRARNPAVALDVRAAIVASCRLLAQFPNLGRRQTIEGVRKFVTRKYRYLVFYAVDDASQELIVLTIQHPARQRGYQDS